MSLPNTTKNMGYCRNYEYLDQKSIGVLKYVHAGNIWKTKSKTTPE